METVREKLIRLLSEHQQDTQPSQEILDTMDKWWKETNAKRKSQLAYKQVTV